MTVRTFPPAGGRGFYSPLIIALAHTRAGHKLGDCTPHNERLAAMVESLRRGPIMRSLREHAEQDVAVAPTATERRELAGRLMTAEFCELVARHMLGMGPP